MNFSRRPKSVARRPMSLSRVSTRSSLRSSAVSRSWMRRSAAAISSRRFAASCSQFSRSRIVSSLPATTALLRSVSASRDASSRMRREVSSAVARAATWALRSARRPAERPSTKKAVMATKATPRTAKKAGVSIRSILQRGRAAETGSHSGRALRLDRIRSGRSGADVGRGMGRSVILIVGGAATRPGTDSKNLEWGPAKGNGNDGHRAVLLTDGRWPMTDHR